MTQKLSQALACFVIGIAYVVILNAYIDIPILRDQIVPGIGADFGDGLAFFFSGIIAYVVATGSASNLVSDLMLPTSVLVLFLLMATLVTSATLGLYIDISNLLSGNDMALLESANRVLPWLQVVSFCLVALTGLNIMVRSSFGFQAPLILGAILLALNAAAVLGHMLGVEWLSGAVSTVSVATSPLAAALLAIIGVIFLLSLRLQRRS